MRRLALPVITIGGMLHLGTLIAIELPILNCEARPECISTGNAIALRILGFPMNAIESLFNLGGRPLTQLMLLAGILNSFVAMTIVWFAVVRPIVMYARRRNANS